MKSEVLNHATMKILIIDDEKPIRDFLKRSLEKECYEVDGCSDGERGSQLAKSGAYDLIILDCGLPKKDGLSVCDEIRKEKINTPILTLSVQASPVTKAELLNAGADDYLSKPFSLEELIARVRALLRRPPSIKADILEIDDLILDNVKHTVYRGKHRIDLTVKEYMLLEYLLSNQGVVISRGKILEHVWDVSADPFSNTIEVHVSNLRKKINLHGKKKIIHTVSGRGYVAEIRDK